MKHNLNSLTKNYLCPRFAAVRKGSRLTKETMAERLCISPRSYYELEKGNCCSSASVLLLFLSLLSNEEILLVVHGFRSLVESQDAAPEEHDDAG